VGADFPLTWLFDRVCPRVSNPEFVRLWSVRAAPVDTIVAAIALLNSDLLADIAGLEG
jgi:hypothetical protein